MTDRNQEKYNEDKGQQPRTNDNDHIIGRVDNTGNPDFHGEENKSDISQVDQQEGTMNNGELGGNLNKGPNGKA